MSLTLYYSPGACSLADHIALEEAGLDYDTVKVDLKSKKTEDGKDFTQINPKGYVPAIDTGDGVLTENAALLVMIAERSKKLLPASGMERYRVLEAVAFITTEIHKSFAPFFHGGSDEEKEEARKKLAKRFEQLQAASPDGDFIASKDVSIADCYAIVMLRWAKSQNVPIPHELKAYDERMRQRPGVRAALEAEGLK